MIVTWHLGSSFAGSNIIYFVFFQSVKYSFCSSFEGSFVDAHLSLHGLGGYVSLHAVYTVCVRKGVHVAAFFPFLAHSASAVSDLMA